jgi:hypothetical protein
MMKRLRMKVCGKYYNIYSRHDPGDIVARKGQVIRLQVCLRLPDDHSCYNKQQQVFEDAVRALWLGLMASRGCGREKDGGKKQRSWLYGRTHGFQMDCDY